MRQHHRAPGDSDPVVVAGYSVSAQRRRIRRSYPSALPHDWGRVAEHRPDEHRQPTASLAQLPWHRCHVGIDVDTFKEARIRIEEQGHRPCAETDGANQQPSKRFVNDNGHLSARRMDDDADGVIGHLVLHAIYVEEECELLEEALGGLIASDARRGALSEVVEQEPAGGGIGVVGGHAPMLSPVLAQRNAQLLPPLLWLARAEQPSPYNAGARCRLVRCQ